MRGYVELPAGKLIKLLDFVRALAQATCPVIQNGASGIACITGKLVPLAVTAHPESSPPLPDTSSARPVDTGLASAIEFRYELTSQDRRHLEEVLPKLPGLRYPLTEGMRVEFIEAYRTLTSNVAWTPILITDEDVEALHRKHHDAWMGHRESLMDAFSAGRLIACNAHHVPVRALGPGCFIPRQSAIEYLMHYRIPYCETDSSSTVSTPTLTGASQQAFLNHSEAIETSPGVDAATDRSRTAHDKSIDHRLPWTEKQYRDLASFHHERTLIGKSPTKDCAEMFGISERTVRKKLVEWRAHPSNSTNLMFRLVGK